MEESHASVKSFIHLQMKQQVHLVTQQMISIQCSVGFKSLFLIIILSDMMQGPDQHDSNCFDFKNLYRIRDIERVTNREVDSPGLLEGVRVGILDEF